MFEICALLQNRTPKAKKTRKPSAPRITVGKACKVFGKPFVVQARDERYPNAWFIADTAGNVAPHSVSRDMITVEA